MTPAEYELFFEDIASRKLIGHNPSTNTTRFVMARVYDTDAQIFKKFDRTAPCMLLEEPVSNPGTNNAGQLIETHLASFAIIGFFDKREIANELTIKRQTRDILLKILGRMIRLKEKEPVKYNWKLESFEIDPEGPMHDGWYGYRLQFEFTDNINSYMIENPDEWLSSSTPTP